MRSMTVAIRRRIAVRPLAHRLRPLITVGSFEVVPALRAAGGALRRLTPDQAISWPGARYPPPPRGWAAAPEARQGRRPPRPAGAGKPIRRRAPAESHPTIAP